MAALVSFRCGSVAVAQGLQAVRAAVLRAEPRCASAWGDVSRRFASSGSASAATASKPVREQVVGAAKGALSVEPLRGASKPPPKAPVDDKCGPVPAEDDDLEDMVQMVDPTTSEWGGPTKGGAMPEPTRFGDWERKGRCTDFC